MSGARNGLGPYLLVVLGLVCRGVFWRVMDLWTGFLISTSPHSLYSFFQGRRALGSLVLGWWDLVHQGLELLSE